MGIFDQFVTGIYQGTGTGFNEPTVRAPVVSGPLLTPGGAPIPYYQTFGFTQPRTQTLTGGKVIQTSGPALVRGPSDFFRVRGVESAAREFFQREPGQEVVSSAPGAADIWRQLVSGFLPTVRAAGQAPARSEAEGFAPAAAGANPPGSRTGMLPLLLAGGLVAALLLMRK